LSLLSLFTTAQDGFNALSFVHQTSGGTARSTAMGGAFGALGGDFSSALQNPAGLGVFRTSEFAVTTEFFYDEVLANYDGISRQGWTNDLSFSHLSYVGAFKLKNRNIVGGSFAIGFNKQNNFMQEAEIEGYNIHSSLVDQYVESANGGGTPVDPWLLDPYTEKLFFDGYIIDWDEYGNYFLNTDIRDGSGNINLNQYKTLSRAGQQNEWSFALGLNIRHLLYVGGSFSIIPVYQRVFTEYSEQEATGGGQQYFRFNQDKITDGTGYTGKLGLIYKPLRFLRLGLAYHLPTNYYLTQISFATLNSYLEGTIVPIDEEGYDLGEDFLDYKLRIPAKSVASLGLMLGKFMIFTTDFEFIDYTGISYAVRGNSYDFSSYNDNIKTDLSYAMNIKSGAELRLKQFYLRGGLAYFGSPYRSGVVSLDTYSLLYSGGLGYRGGRFYIDLALSYTEAEVPHTLYETPYSTDPVTAAFNSETVRTLATVGIRF
jgi:hypothetical protein